MIGSHTAGEPTGTVISTSPPFEYGSLRDYRNHLCRNHLYSRSAVVTKMLHSEVAVGAVLCNLFDPACVTGVIFRMTPAIWPCTGMTQSK
jgi:proline racemase